MSRRPLIDVLYKAWNNAISSGRIPIEKFHCIYNSSLNYYHVATCLHVRIDYIFIYIPFTKI